MMDVVNDEKSLYTATALYHRRVKEIGGEEDKPLRTFVFYFILLTILMWIYKSIDVRQPPPLP